MVVLLVGQGIGDLALHVRVHPALEPGTVLAGFNQDWGLCQSSNNGLEGGEKVTDVAVAKLPPAKQGTHLLRNRKRRITPEHYLCEILVEDEDAVLCIGDKPL